MTNGNAAVYFVDRHVDEGRGNKTVFREADGAKRSLTYAQLKDQAGQFAGALTRAGVRREERVALIVRDQLEFPVAFFGAMKSGAVPVPFNTLLAAPVYDAILNDSRASIMVVSAARQPRLDTGGVSRALGNREARHRRQHLSTAGRGDRRRA